MPASYSLMQITWIIGPLGNLMNLASRNLQYLQKSLSYTLCLLPLHLITLGYPKVHLVGPMGAVMTPQTSVTSWGTYVLQPIELHRNVHLPWVSSLWALTAAKCSTWTSRLVRGPQIEAVSIWLRSTTNNTNGLQESCSLWGFASHWFIVSTLRIVCINRARSYRKEREAKHSNSLRSSEKSFWDVSPASNKSDSLFKVPLMGPSSRQAVAIKWTRSVISQGTECKTAWIPFKSDYSLVSMYS
jgi:hypothetical protein